MGANMDIIDTDAARNDLQEIDRQIKELQERIRSLQERRAELDTFLRLCAVYHKPLTIDLLSSISAPGVAEFVEGLFQQHGEQLAAVPEEPPPSPTETAAVSAVVSSAAPTEASAASPPRVVNVFNNGRKRYTLNRDMSNRQTQVAMELSRRYKPG